MSALSIACSFCKPFEGVRTKVYRDICGYPTIGVGHLLTKDKTIPLSQFPPITMEEVDRLLQEDMNKSVWAVYRLTKGTSLTDNQIAALADFSFNLGTAAFQNSTLRKCIIRGDFEAVPFQLSKWSKANGRVVKQLTRRRKAEADLFLSGA
jgi:lysozyme